MLEKTLLSVQHIMRQGGKKGLRIGKQLKAPVLWKVKKEEEKLNLIAVKMEKL